MIHVKVGRESIEATEKELLISGSHKIYFCQFTFTDDFEGFDRTAVFDNGSLRKRQPLDLQGVCVIPCVERLIRENADKTSALEAIYTGVTE